MNLQEAITNGFAELKALIVGSDSARSQVEQLTQENAELKASIEEKDTALVALANQLAEAEESLDALSVEIDELKAKFDESEDRVEKEANTKALDIAAAQGIDPLPEAATADDASQVLTKEQAWQQYNTLPIEERNDFYAKHRDLLKPF